MEPTEVKKGQKKDENHNKSAHIDDCSSVKGEPVLVLFCEVLKYRNSSTK